MPTLKLLYTGFVVALNSLWPWQ